MRKLITTKEAWLAFFNELKIVELASFSEALEEWNEQLKKGIRDSGFNRG